GVVASDVDVTNPLPPVATPYGSDVELTRPIAPNAIAEIENAAAPGPGLHLPMPSAPPLRSVTLPPPPAPPRSSVPVVVAVPPRSAAPMEHPPSIQIAQSAGRRSVPPPPPSMAPRRSTPPPPPAPSYRPEAFGTLPRIPRPAPVPKDLEARGSSRRSSLAPTTGSVPPPAAPLPRRWVTAL